MSHPCREHDIAFLSQTYADLEAVNRELENERERHKVDVRDIVVIKMMVTFIFQVTMNELAKANEELENVATQLYETGQTLDETNAEVGGACKSEYTLQHVLCSY